MKYLLALLISLSILPVWAADLSLNPSSLKLKIYAMYVSTNVLCTNPTLVLTVSNPTYTDILSSPNFGAGTLADGTYPCVMFLMSSVIKYTTATTSTSNHCVGGTEYTGDVCQTGDSSTLADGSTTTCTTNTADQVLLYLTTAVTATNNTHTFKPPTTVGDTSNALPLTSALVVSGTSSGKFIVNGTGKICDNADVGCSGGGGTSCEMLPPSFGFSKL